MISTPPARHPVNECATVVGMTTTATIHPLEARPGDELIVNALGACVVVATPADWEDITVQGETVGCGHLTMVTPDGAPFGWFVCGDDELRVA